MMRRRGFGVLLALALGVYGGAPSAQGVATGTVASPILIVDQEELFRQSAFGQRIREDIAARIEALARENRQIELELVAEELALTERRETTPAEDFAALAEAFDTKVTAVRAEQDAKSLAIEAASDEAQQAFFARVARILGDIMRDRGATALIDGRAVLLSAESIDITAEAIARIDAEIGEGQLELQDSDTPAPDSTDPAPDTPQGAPDAPDIDPGFDPGSVVPRDTPDPTDSP